ncbi:MAG: sugar ABC transporter substrate-binding protein, partial [Alicyclobacillus shizuokensis]|nr:sugar ABC transporter substrate-binding protein [Alicyclobacillus shizuokensis]
MKPRLWTAAGIAAMITLTVTACGSGSGNTSGASNTSSGGSSSSGGAKGTIALLLPDTTSSPRWETQDKPDFEKEVKKLDPNAKVIYENAQASSSTQQQQAESAMTNGAK